MNRVSYIVAAYKAGPFLKKCVDSLRDQEMPPGWDYEILIGVDACEDTLDAAKPLADGNKVRVLEMLEHSGPYVTANTLVSQSTGNWLFRVDADDVCEQGRTKQMLRNIHRKNARMSNTFYREVDTEGNEVASYKKPAEGNWAYRRDLWDEIGGWEAWECAADSMFLVKAKRLEGGREAVVGRALYTRLLHPDQLTADPVLGKRTAARERRRKMVAAELQRCAAGRLPRKTKTVFAEFVEHFGDEQEQLRWPRVTASMATVPEREKQLRKAVQSLLPQVDRLNVYLNGHESIPKFLADDARITVAWSKDKNTPGDLGDAGKFYWADQVAGVHLTCDDDIIYPRDYVKTMLRALKKYQWRAAVSQHGRVLPEQPRSYYNGQVQMWHCANDSEGGLANVLGTGVLAYHTDNIKLSIVDFPEPNMADVWFALACQKQKVPCICLPHEANWIQVQHVERTIWAASKAQDGSAMDTRARQSELVREVKWAVHEPSKTRMHVAVTTYSRPESVLELLRDLREEQLAGKAELSVSVYNDASSADYSKVKQFCKDNDFGYKRYRQNRGRERHHEVVSDIYADMRKVKADLYCVLPDDCRLLPGFCASALNEWHNISDKSKASLAVAVLKGREEAGSWNAIPTKEINNSVQVGWVDGFNVFTRDYLETLDWQVLPAKSRGQISSGMGRGITKRLVAAGKTMYRVPKSLVVSLDLPSVMHPEARKETPLPTVNHLGEPTLPRVFERAEVQGIRINVFPNDHIGKALLAGGYYELDLLQTIEAMRLKGVYVDVGAFVGTHTLWFAKRCPSTKVLAVEPQAKCAALIRKSTKDSGVQNKVEVVHGAIHDTLARVAIVPAGEDNKGMTQVREGQSVIAWRLDSLLENVDDVALIKLDVEGLEPAALRSAKQVIERHKPVLITEAWNEEALALQQAELPGYTPSKPYCRTPTYIWTR